MTVDPLVALFVGAFGAAGLAGIFTLVGLRIQANREHERWVRQQRLAAYLDYVRLAEKVPTINSRTGEEAKKFSDDLQAANATLRLLGPEHVFNAATSLTVAALRVAQMKAEPDANRDELPAADITLSEARLNLVAAAQKELGIHA